MDIANILDNSNPANGRFREMKGAKVGIYHWSVWKKASKGGSIGLLFSTQRPYFWWLPSVLQDGVKP